MGTWKVSNEQRREYYPKRKLRRRQRDNKGKAGKTQVRRCSSSKRYDVIGQFLLVGTAAKSGRLRANTKDRCCHGCCFHHHRTRQENGRPTNQQPWLHKSFLSAKDLTRLTPKGGQDLSPTFQGPKVKKCHQQDLNLRQLRLRPEHSALDHSAIVTTLRLCTMNFKYIKFVPTFMYQTLS